MLADPVARAHAQQTSWLYNRCFRDAREAASAARGSKGRLAKGAAPGCERMDASSQLRLELGDTRLLLRQLRLQLSDVTARRTAACQQRHRCHLEKNATQMAAISWRLTASRARPR